MDTRPCCLRTRAVCAPQEYPGDDLNDEREAQRAAPDVAPAGAPRHILQEHVVNELLVSRPLIEPGQQCAHATGTFVALPASKLWNLTQTSEPSRISTSNPSRARGLGLRAPATRLPSRLNRLSWHGHRKLRTPALNSTGQPACGQVTFRASTL